MQQEQRHTPAVEHPMPQRVMHTVNLAAVIGLGLTGWWIHTAALPQMGVRWAHMTLAAILVLNMFVRIYYAYMGRHADAEQFGFRKGDGGETAATLRYYLFVGGAPRHRTRYNPMQKGSYLAIIALILFQLVTGMALYEPQEAAAVVSFFGGLALLRSIHYLVMWVFVAFVVLHVYLAFTEAPSAFLEMFFLDRGRGTAQQRMSATHPVPASQGSQLPSSARGTVKS